MLTSTLQRLQAVQECSLSTVKSFMEGHEILSNVLAGCLCGPVLSCCLPATRKPFGFSPSVVSDELSGLDGKIPLEVSGSLSLCLFSLLSSGHSRDRTSCQLPRKATIKGLHMESMPMTAFGHTWSKSLLLEFDDLDIPTGVSASLRVVCMLSDELSMVDDFRN